MVEGLSERLKIMLAGRKIYPWGLCIGLSNGAISHLSKGAVPGYELQTIIQRQEGVSWRWLAEGESKPFEVETYIDAGDFGERFEYLIGDVDNQCFIIEFGQICTFVTITSKQYEQKGKLFDYAKVVIITGPYHQCILNSLNNFAEQRDIYRTNIDAATQKEIRNGQLGIYALFGDDKKQGLLSNENCLSEVDKLRAPSKFDKVQLVDIQLMRAVILIVEQTIIEQQVNMTIEDKTKVIASVYTYALRTNKTADTLDVQSALVAIDTL
jgi:hypothetical protein